MPSRRDFVASCTPCPRSRIVPTGQSFAADPDETVLAAALRAGLNLPHSCKGGHCASCRARILVGRDRLSRRAAARHHRRTEARRGLRAAVPGAGGHGPARRDARDAAGARRRGEEPAVPHRSHGAPGRRRHGRVPAPAGGRGAALPAGPVPRRHAVGGPPAQLLDRERAGRRPAARAARAARVDERLHRPAVRHHARRHAAAHRGPARAVLVPRRFAAAAADGRRRHGLRAAARDAAAAARHRRPPPGHAVLGRRATCRDLYEHDWLQALAATRPGFSYRPVLSGRRPSDGVAGTRAASCTRPCSPIYAGPRRATTSTRAGRRR